MSEPAIEVRGLQKIFRVGFFRKRVEAVRGIDFSVHRGEVFGLLGPNGAGKTTTIKAILGLIFPTRGAIEIFGSPPGPDALRNVGYMPENPYVYQYLNCREFLDLCGRLVGMEPHTRRQRADALIERLGLSHATDRAIGKFSKGMMQRIGLAQALLHEPELLILDEPMSGLDPIGRKEVRDVLMEQKVRGKTLIFTSHILSDVETLCDRVTILQGGRVSASGRLADLLRLEARRTEVACRIGSPVTTSEIKAAASSLVSSQESDGRLVLVVEGDALPVVRKAVELGAEIESVTPQRESLEALFLREAVRK